MLIDCAPSLNALTRTAWAATRPRHRRHRARPVLRRRRRPRAARDRGDPSRPLPAPAAARHHRQPRPRAVARAPVPHQGAARHVRAARALARSCPSARRCSRRRAPRSRCTSGRARARRRWRATSTSCSSACMRTARIGEFAERLRARTRAVSAPRGALRRSCGERRQPRRAWRDERRARPAGRAGDRVELDELVSTSRSTLPTAMPKTPWPRLTRSMTSSFEVHR